MQTESRPIKQQLEYAWGNFVLYLINDKARIMSKILRTPVILNKTIKSA